MRTKPNRLIVMFHGFGSNGESSTTCQAVKARFDNVVCPTYRSVGFDTIEKDVVDQIRPLLNGVDELVMVGISLGGFMARYFANHAERLFGIQCFTLVMLNPALHAPKSIRKYMGKNIHFVTDEEFEVTEKEVQDLLSLMIFSDKPELHITVITSDDDDIVWPGLAREMYARRARLVNYPDGGHRLSSRIDEILLEIEFEVNNISR